MLWLRSGASFFIFARAGEMFTNKEERWNDGYILHRWDVIFFLGSTQLDWKMWGQADRV